MHIPDGILNTPLLASTNSLTTIIITLIWKRIKRNLTGKTVPKVALLSAFLFVAQMINIPISFGSSAHLAGATLTVLIVGPEVAILIMVLVISVQMLIFQDGGLLAWGANVFNTGIAPIVVSYLLLSLSEKLLGKYSQSLSVRVFVILSVAWLSTQMSAIFCGIELGLSGLAQLAEILGIMIFIYSGIGVLEGFLTVVIFE